MLTLLLLPILSLAAYNPEYDLASEIFGGQETLPYQASETTPDCYEVDSLLGNCLECQVLHQFWRHFSSAYNCQQTCQQYEFNIIDASGNVQAEAPVAGFLECASVADSYHAIWKKDDNKVDVYLSSEPHESLEVNAGVWYGGQVVIGSDILPQGWGELVYHEQDYLDRQKYVGYMVEGAMDGYGNLYWHDGSVYSGQFSNNVKQGFGTLFYSNGDVFEGKFDGEKKAGEGLYKFVKGANYFGGFSNGNWEGLGTFQTDNLGLSWNQFKGQYLEGGKNEGELTFVSGDTYQGKFERTAGTYSGHGKYVWACGRVYTGDFVNGLPDGEDGELLYPEAGWKYFGEFSEGKFNGFGIFKWTDQEHWFQGLFFQGKMTGCGKFQLEDGGLYEVNQKDSSEEDEDDFCLGPQSGLYYPDRNVLGNSFEATFDGETLRYRVPVVKSGGVKGVKKGGYGK